MKPIELPLETGCEGREAPTPAAPARAGVDCASLHVSRPPGQDCSRRPHRTAVLEALGECDSRLDPSDPQAPRGPCGNLVI